MRGQYVYVNEAKLVTIDGLTWCIEVFKPSTGAVWYVMISMIERFSHAG